MSFSMDLLCLAFLGLGESVCFHYGHSVSWSLDRNNRFSFHHRSPESRTSGSEAMSWT